MAQDAPTQPRSRRPVALLLIVGALIATFFILRDLRNGPRRSHRGGQVPAAPTGPIAPERMIKQLGGNVESSGPKQLAVTMWVATDTNLQHVLDLEHVVSLDLSGSSVTDRGLRRLQAMTELEVLKLDATPITDDGLESLNSLSKLQHLSLIGTSIRGPGLAHLKELPELRVLFLGNTLVDDKALAHLAAMPRLEVLFLNGVPPAEVAPEEGERDTGRISDAGLIQLGDLTALKILDVQNTNVTEAGATELRAALPSCHVRY